MTETVREFFKKVEQEPKFVPFKFSDEFIFTYENKPVPWDALGEFSYMRTYSRTIKMPDGSKHKEKWHETIRRVVEGVFTFQKLHCIKHRVPWNNTKAQNSAKIMYDLMFNMKFLPPGRGIWMMGTDYVYKRGGAALNSCSFVSSKNIALEKTLPFEFLMDMSMLGVGVGFDVHGQGTLEIQKPRFIKDKIVIPDTREGWVETMAITLNGYLSGTEIPEFDYSQIRPAGTIIEGFGGEASGPQPLIHLVEFIVNHYNKRIGKMISIADIVDTFNNIGKCVVSGNVRRSAEIALCNADICGEFLQLKDPTLYKKELAEYRWVSNNSIICPIGADYSGISEYIAKNGEPGIIWMQNIREYGRMGDFPNNLDYKADGVNPCCEQSLEHMETCNLVETFPSRHDSYEEFERTLKYAYLYAKTVTLIPTHWEQTNAVMLRNRRIGTSQSGIIDAFAKHGRSKMLAWSDRGYKYIRHMDNVYSDWLCIPRSIKVTSVKPSGTVSLLPNVSPGIHYRESQYYIRRVVISNISELGKIMRDAGYKVEKYHYDPDHAVCVEFPVSVENFFKGASEVTMWEQLLNASDYQKFWSDNQVSVTIRFKEHEKKDIANALSIFDTKLKAVSMLPYSDHGYIQAPYEQITKEQYEKMIKGLKKPDYTAYIEQSIGERGCDGDTCQLPKH